MLWTYLDVSYYRRYVNYCNFDIYMISILKNKKFCFFRGLKNNSL